MIGGARPNAGRPKEVDKARVVCYVLPVTEQVWRRESFAGNFSLGEYIDSLIQTKQKTQNEKQQRSDRTKRNVKPKPGPSLK